MSLVISISCTYMIKAGKELSSGAVMAIHDDEESIKHHGNPLLHWKEIRLNL